MEGRASRMVLAQLSGQTSLGGTPSTRPHECQWWHGYLERSGQRMHGSACLRWRITIDAVKPFPHKLHRCSRAQVHIFVSAGR